VKLLPGPAQNTSVSPKAATVPDRRPVRNPVGVNRFFSALQRVGKYQLAFFDVTGFGIGNVTNGECGSFYDHLLKVGTGCAAEFDGQI
jgi:hypothetical protein